MLGDPPRVKPSARRALLVSAFVALFPSAALAEPPAPPGIAPPPRSLPEYDGRPPTGTTAADALLWVPRTILFPLHVVTEYVFRRPLGFLVISAERGKWAEVLSDVFTFGPSNNIGIVPTALLDFGFQPSVGIYGFHDDFLFKDNALRVHAATGGPDWLRLTVADRIPVAKNGSLVIRGEAVRRPDLVFYGIGPLSQRSFRSRYGSDWIDGSAAFHASLPVGLTADAYMGARTTSFYGTRCCGDRSLRANSASGAFPIPPGYEEGYTSLRSGGKLAFDTRRPRPAPGSGMRVEGVGEFATDLRAPRVSSWIKYGGTLGGFIDVTGFHHVLSLSATALFTDPVQGDTIPFTELVSLGGFNHMSGFLPGRLLGRSAAVATMEYRYPIWAFLDGSAQVAVGNVFNEHLTGLAPENLRLSFTFGVRAAGERDHSFSILVGAGTETFGQGATLNEVRLVLGATRTF